MPRLGHKKSRNGCRQCKARHVKCDESKPCGSCARHGVPCSLMTWDPDSSPVAGATSTSTSGPGSSASSSTSARSAREWSRRGSYQASEASQPPSLHAIDEFQNPTPTPTFRGEESESPASSTDTFPFLTKLVHKKDASEYEDWARDLELIHHWTTDACLSMCPRDDIKKMWTIAAPKEAIQHTYLMHQMLCFSALHIAHHQAEHQSEQRAQYHALAINHQDLAIKAMRPKLTHITNENASHLFATSTLVSMCVFGERSLNALNYGGGGEPLEDLLDAFALLQGMGGLFATSHMLVLKSPFAPMLIPGTVPTPPQPIFNLLLARIPDAVAFIGKQKDIPEDVQRECVVQLLAFQDVLQHGTDPSQDSREMRLLFFWPVHLKPNFAVWARRKHSCVLVLIAFYAVALRAGEPVHWFCKGWAERVIRAVDEHIEEEWRVAIQWPWEFIMGVEAQQRGDRRVKQEPSSDMDVRMEI
ncbi:hypothetical protein K505DRAFT_317301 [Melanomma pulvis-pyrius CBS 109.77]|uniref:Zn(2)-C6 fungal-type domain-containing protein n=1 Tax=Melanomma pulvis-pyrius CBS 109.77 TaxID=1314802 RepID=A0A6A6WT49_9PLEO|nr:hypothetical protein K505DRAFT_317301 [Melanomma pulvis-pyrius CBS 109.77]